MIRAAAALCMGLVTTVAANAGAAALTPVGAEQPANAAGTIPEWAGAARATSSEAGTAEPLSDPFSLDQPRFIVTRENYQQYAAVLSQGHRRLLLRDATYTMPVYATRRTATFPQAIYDATAKNFDSASLVGVDGITGARLGFPFPKPRSGVEVLWNHRLRYRGDAAEWRYKRAVVFADGSLEFSTVEESSLYGYANIGDPGDVERDNIQGYTKLTIAPCESTYSFIGVLWHEPVNPLITPRRVWAFGGGRAYREPSLGYDEIGLCSRRLRYFDMVDMFNGAFDRYSFKLLGKRELLIPYHGYRLWAGTAKDVVRPAHLEQARARYELHRVWVVEATLRPGQKHRISKRLFYVDEDSWSIALAECFDEEGKLWRFQEGHILPLARRQAVDYAPLVVYDLKDGRYFVDRLLTDNAYVRLNVRLQATKFTPAAAKGGLTR